MTEEKQEHLPQYSDRLVGNHLCMEGEQGHVNDQRLVDALDEGDAIHLFQCSRHHEPFTYYGEIELMDHQLKQEKPSLFLFRFLHT